MKGVSFSETVAVGCVVGVISLAAQSVGLTLQRRSHIEEDEKPLNVPRKPAYKRPMWQVGLLLFLLSNVIGSSVQITTLPLIILSPLQAVGLIFNSACSSLLLSEPFTNYAMLGTILVAIGALLVAFFGVVPDPHHNLAEHLVLLHRRPFVIWMVITFMVMIAILIFIHIAKSWEPNPKHPDRIQLLRGAMYGVVCGILSAHSLLMAKSAVEICVRGFSDHWKDLKQYQSWVIVLFFLCFAVSQLYFLNCGLHLCSTSVIFPLIFCIYNIVTIMNGLIYFEQTSDLTLVHYIMIAIGTLLILIGVVCLSWRLGLNDDLGLHQHLLRRRTSLEDSPVQHYVDQDPIDGTTSQPKSLFSVFNAKPEYTSFHNLAIPSDGKNGASGSKLLGETQRTISSHAHESSPLLDDNTASYLSFTSNNIVSPTELANAFTEPVSPFTAAASKKKYRLNGMNSPHK